MNTNSIVQPAVAAVDPSAAESLRKPAMFDELKQPLPAWPTKTLWVSVFAFAAIIGSVPSEPRWLAGVLISASFLTTVFCLVSVIARLNKRVEALTFLLLEQQNN